MDCIKLFSVFMNRICRDESRYTRHVRAISGYPISIDFHRLTGCRRDPRVLGRHRPRYPWLMVSHVQTMHVKLPPFGLLPQLCAQWLLDPSIWPHNETNIENVQL